VSVLLPCYNAAATLDEAVESILRQTLSNLELVAVDDGSTDATADCLRSWSGRDARVRVLGQAHAGIIPALNLGLAACRARVGSAALATEVPKIPTGKSCKLLPKFLFGNYHN
jgi:glycosyltransferase involved in cell wall biosynthesis